MQVWKIKTKIFLCPHILKDPFLKTISLITDLSTFEFPVMMIVLP